MLNCSSFLSAIAGLVVIGSLGCGTAAPEDRADTGTTDAAARDAETTDVGPMDAAAPDLGFRDAEPTDATAPDLGSPDTGPMDAGTPDTGPMDIGPPDTGSVDAGNLGTTPMTVTPTYVQVDGTAPRGTSEWAIAGSPTVQPQETRSTTFFGRFQQNACAQLGYGPAVAHPFALGAVSGTVQDAFFPDCQGAYGPSADASVTVNRVRQHLLRSEVRPAAAFQTFGVSGQNGSGANAHILATYTAFNPRWRPTEPDRFKPWNASPGSAVDPNRLRVAFRIRESVTTEQLADPLCALT